MTLAEAIEQTLIEQGYEISDDIVDAIEDFVESVEIAVEEGADRADD